MGRPRQLTKFESTERSTYAPRIPRHTYTRQKLTVAERRARIDKAQLHASETGTSLVDALKMEGVL